MLTDGLTLSIMQTKNLNVDNVIKDALNATDQQKKTVYFVMMASLIP